METTRILWSGLTGRTGREAVKAAYKMPDVKIVIGVKRQVFDDCFFCPEFEGVKWRQYGQICCDRLDYLSIESGIDVIVDFSNPEVFDEVLKVAIHTGKPFVSGTSGLSNRQMASLYDATNHIPIFRGGNFRFKVKKFIDEAVELARNLTGGLVLYENFYEGKGLPSETSKVVQRRVLEATGKTIRVHSSADLPKEQLPCDWRFGAENDPQNMLRCHTIGFDELAHDVLEIAKVMTAKPARAGKFYDLDEIWEDLT